MMTDHQKETAFLRHCIRYDESPGREALDEKIIRIQRDERCLYRAVWLMAVMAALAFAGLGYAAILMDDYPERAAQFFTRFVVQVLGTLALTALISVVAFGSLRMIYRRKLDQRREECRQLVTRLLESRLGKPVTPPWCESRVPGGKLQPAPVAAAGSGSPGQNESSALG